jgi:hypothetical protein
MQDAKAYYEKRQREQADILAAIAKRFDIIAWSRLATFLAALALFLGSYWAKLGFAGYSGACLLALIFVALVITHARLDDRRNREQALLEHAKRGLSRLDGTWTKFPSDGSCYLKTEHPYALDIDIFGPSSLFQLLDDTRTRIGQSTLASWLCAPAEAKEIHARQESIRELAQIPALREATAVATIRADESHDLHPLIEWANKGPQTAIPALVMLFGRLLPLAFIVTFCAYLALSTPGWIPLSLYALNLLVSRLLSPRLNSAIKVVSKRSEQLATFAAVLGVIESAPVKSSRFLEIKQALSETGVGASVEIARLSRIVSMLDARQNEVFAIFIGPALLWDFHCVAAIEKWQSRAGRHVKQWFDCVGDAEALLSLSALHFERPSHCFPEVIDNALVLEARGLGHPLIDEKQRVCNDVTMPGSGSVLLVTGSNMSGKSTLLRSIGIATALAMAGAPVCADALRIGVCDLRTSMRVSDSLRDGISRFYAELLKIKAVVDTAEKSHHVLFLLDEILHGTNSRERHIGARCIIKTLIRCGAMGAVSTHDLALADMEQTLPENVHNVHFQELVQDDKMLFDYKLRSGVVQSGNALQWMRVVGLKVDEAG